MNKKKFALGVFAALRRRLSGGLAMNKKKFALGVFAALLAAALLVGCGSKSALRFGAAGLGGVYQSFAASYAQLAGDAGVELEVKTTAGSAANLRLLSQGYIQLAIAQADIADDAYYGTDNFAEQSYQGYSAVASLYTEACQIVVRKDSGISSVEQLLGKKVSIGEAESGTEQNAMQILAAAGLSAKVVDTVNLNYTDAAEQLASGDIDAMFCTAGIQTTVIEALAEQCDIALLPVSEVCLQKLSAQYDFYGAYTIPAGTYTGQSEDVTTVGIRSVLLASDKLSNDTVETLTALLFEKQAELQYSVPVDLELNLESAAEGVTIPFHPGAASYYEANGVQVQTAEGK